MLYVPRKGLGINVLVASAARGIKCLTRPRSFQNSQPVGYSIQLLPAFV